MMYTLMRKDVPLCLLHMSEGGDIISVGKKLADDKYFPMQNKQRSNGLNYWWKNRAVPIGQGNIKKILEQEGLLASKDYLLKNLGLSLTDYYWIKPSNSGLTWKDVNLFDNDFKENLTIVGGNSQEKEFQYSPSSSLQGQLEKSWVIVDNERVLIKGNSDNLSSESINEVIATEVHKGQGYDNYTAYKLMQVAGSEYDYGCMSKSFTSSKKELVSAYDIVTSEKQPNDISTYEFFIQLCAQNGIDEEQLRADLEYQIMTDFILTNKDRHLNNIAVLRDAESLQFLRMAPIFDTGMSFLVGSSFPFGKKSMLDVKTTSFVSTELKLLSYVRDKRRVDINKLPSVERIRVLYQKDSQLEEEYIEHVCQYYEWKIDLLDKFQHGVDLKAYKHQL